MNKKLLIKIALITIFISMPILSSNYFLTQDGSAHIYSSYIISELLTNDSLYSNYFAFNSFATPNALGHYVIALLLQVFSPFIVSKIISIITLLGLPFSLLWLRYVTKGENGLLTTFLIGAAISFNWLWLAGFYNFLLGSILLIITLGLFYKWKDSFNYSKLLALSILFLLVYLSHLICFLVLSGSILAMLLPLLKEKQVKQSVFVLLSFVPSLLFIIIYRLNTQSESVPFRPSWRYLDDSSTLINWLKQISTVDTFFIISRKTLPFIESFSSIYFLFAPIVWPLVITLILLYTTIYKQNLKKHFTLDKFPFIFLFLFSIAFSLVAPDDFGSSNGTVLRERIFFFSFVFLIPLFEVKNKSINTICKVLLIIVIGFQTFATFEYSVNTSNIATNFSKIEDKLKAKETYATITILSKSEKRFAATPIPQMSNVFGINKKLIIWDNYEMGHYLFPIVANTSERRKIILRFTRNNVIEKNSRNDLILEKTSILNSILDNDSNGIDNLIIYGYDENIEKYLNFISNSKKGYSDKNIRLYRLRK